MLGPTMDVYDWIFAAVYLIYSFFDGFFESWIEIYYLLIEIDG